MTNRAAIYVFISYSHDDASFAASFSTRLHRAGIPHFRDTEAIEWGENIPARVHAALEKATHLVVLISPGSEQSQWVAYEMGYARGHNVTLVPYLLHPRMKLPGFLTNIRYLQTKADEKKFITSLQAVLKLARPQVTKKYHTRDTKQPESRIKEGLKKARSQHPQVRQDGVAVLVEVRAESDLLELLGHRDRYVRSVGAKGLALLRSKQALKYLIDGLGFSSRRSRIPIIPDVEHFFVHYGQEALDELLKRIPESFAYPSPENRWVVALTNAVTTDTIPRLLARATATGRDMLLQASLQSGLKLRKRDLEPAIRAYVRKKNDSSYSHMMVAGWISGSPNSTVQWAQHLVRHWLDISIAECAPQDKYSWYNIRKLAQSALSMNAITAKELAEISQSITNHMLADALAKLANEWKDNR